MDDVTVLRGMRKRYADLNADLNADLGQRRDRGEFASFDFPSKLICATGSNVLCGRSKRARISSRLKLPLDVLLCTCPLLIALHEMNLTDDGSAPKLRRRHGR